MSFSFYIILSCLLGLQVAAQKLGNLGVNGGSGHEGGIGDRNNPVKESQAWITDAKIPLKANTTRQLAKGRAPVRRSSNSTGGYSVVIDDAHGIMQEMAGFGHAWTDSTVTVFNQLDPDVLDKLMKELFGAEGNNMGFMRHTIGSSDLSGENYSYDDTPDNEPDLDLSYFDIGPHGRAMADIIAKMGDYKSDVTTFGSPWSAPAWMKKNHEFIAPNLNVQGEGSYGITNNTFDIRYFRQYALYFAKYIDAFAERGARISGITMENEPLNPQGGYPCMWLDAADEGTLIAQAGLGQLMSERGVGIWAYDHNTGEQCGTTFTGFDAKQRCRSTQLPTTRCRRCPWSNTGCSLALLREPGGKLLQARRLPLRQS